MRRWDRTVDFKSHRPVLGQSEWPSDAHGWGATTEFTPSGVLIYRPLVPEAENRDRALKRPPIGMANVARHNGGSGVYRREKMYS